VDHSFTALARRANLPANRAIRQVVRLCAGRLRTDVLDSAMEILWVLSERRIGLPLARNQA
jgi:hypothetical protein